jgi:gas vesicle protein
MKNGKILLALLGGAAAGLAIGLLFAPAKGSETRDKLMNDFDGLSDDLKEKASGLKDRVTENVNKMKDRMKPGAEEAGYTSGDTYGSRSGSSYGSRSNL